MIDTQTGLEGYIFKERVVLKLVARKSIYREAFDGILLIYSYKIKQQEQREHQFNILLVLTGVLSVALFNLYTWDVAKSKPWGISAIPLILAYFISIYHVFPKKNLKPWILKEDYEKVVAGKKSVSNIFKELNITMYLLVYDEKDKADKRERKNIAFVIYLIVLVFTSLSINLLLNSFCEIISVTVVTFFIIGVLFYYMFHKSEKDMITARDAINKKIDEYMKTQ